MTGSGGPLPGLPKNKLTPVEAQKNQQTEEILNSILPPREWSEEGQLWKQCVSSTPATRLDVINLQVYMHITCTCSCMLHVHVHAQRLYNIKESQGSVCMMCVLCTGATGYKTSAKAGQRNRDLSSEEGTVLTMLW